MKKILALLLLLIGLSAQGQTQNKSYPATLKKFMETIGMMEMFKTAIDQTMSQVRTTYPAVSEEAWIEFEKEVSATSLDDLVSILAPVYEKYLSEADLKELIKFYTSPVGKKMTVVMSSVTEESRVAGEVWAEKLAERIQVKMKEKGH